METLSFGSARSLNCRIRRELGSLRETCHTSCNLGSLWSGFRGVEVGSESAIKSLEHGQQ